MPAWLDAYLPESTAASRRDDRYARARDAARPHAAKDCVQCDSTPLDAAGRCPRCGWTRPNAPSTEEVRDAR